MKRLGGVWPQIVSFDNLLLAYRLFRIYERKPRIIAAAPFHDRPNEDQRPVAAPQQGRALDLRAPR